MSRDRDWASTLRGESADLPAMCRHAIASCRDLAAYLWARLQDLATLRLHGRIYRNARRRYGEVRSSRCVSLAAAAISGDVLPRSADLHQHGLLSSRDEPASPRIPRLSDEVSRFSENVCGSSPRGAHPLRT